MGGKKYKMPSNKYFLKKKRIADPRKDPVWVYLEKEMRANIDKKPYNKKVGSWLAFLKDLKGFYRCERKSAKKKLVKEIGPRWYTEFTSFQRKTLQGFRTAIHHDEISNLPINVRQTLRNLGITRKLSNSFLMKVVSASMCDPGIFMWYLYENIYNVSPCVLQKRYDLDGIIIMSSFVFIDLKECLQVLEDLTKYRKKTRRVAPKSKEKKVSGIPDIRYGEYLQKNHVTLSYTALRLAPDFLEKRKKKNMQEVGKERICSYKFWEPPSSLRNTDPKKAAYVEKLKLLKQKANIHYKTPFKNVRYELAGVSFVGNTPQYILSNSVVLPTGYTIVNGGIVTSINGEGYTNIQGNWLEDRKEKDSCSQSCDCVEKWEQQAISYCKKSKCNCKHFYDFNGTGKCKHRYFHPPTKHGPFWIDNDKVFKLNSLEDFVKGCVKDAVRSDPATPNLSTPSIRLATVSKKKLLKALLAEISDTPLFIPHLPQAHLLNNLLEWVRNRVRGKLTPKQHKKYKLKSQRRWLQLKHLDFRANCYYIPFTLKQLKHMTFEHRGQMNKLLEVLHENFIRRNRLKQVELARLMWPTTKYDAYPQKAFLDTYFAYMPSRSKDSYLINPYDSEKSVKSGAKTCPILI